MEYGKNGIRNGLSAESHARQNLNDLARKYEENPDVPDPLARVFKCKECNRTFAKFEALGGHVASHKKPRSSRDGSSTSEMLLHPCKICGEKFEIGQALGGHMRKHQGMKHEAGEVNNVVCHVLQQPKVEAFLQEQKAKSDPFSEGVMSKDYNFKEETSTSDSGRQEFQFCDLRVPVDEDEGASHTANQITYYEFL